MKPAFAQIEAITKKLPAGVNAALVYGPDAGLADGRAGMIAAQITGPNPDPFSVSEIAPEKVKEDVGAIAEELSSISFFGGRKLVKVRGAADAIAAALGQALKFLTRDTGGSFLLVTAGELGPRSSLRLLFEKEKHAVAIPCYQDDAGALARIVAAKLRGAGFEWEDGVIETISGNLVGDRMVLNGEIEKLFTFKGEDKNVTLADVSALLADSGESSLDELCISVADRDAGKLYRLYAKLLLQGVEPVRMIRQLIGYFSRINTVYGKIKASVSEQEAIAALKPPVFFKNLPHFKRHIGFWAKSGPVGNAGANENKLDKVFEILLSAELDAKKSGNPDLICADYLLQICRVR